MEHNTLTLPSLNNTLWTFTATAPLEEDGEDWGFPQRLDKYLSLMAGELLSRERIKHLIQSEHVQVNEKTITKPAFIIEGGEEVTLHLPEAEPIALQPEAIPLEIMYEDDVLMVLHKPRQMLTHPVGQRVTGTLVNAILHHCHGKLSGINGLLRPGIVHRLDADTCGLMVVAKSDIAHRKLSDDLKARTVKREYWAVVQGHPQGASGTIEAPLGRHPQHRQKMHIDPLKGRFARTHWHVVDCYHGPHGWGKFSLIQCELDTGRTHQIRVHLASIGHPLVGDPLYGTGLEKHLPVGQKGQLLQAFRLSFHHPITGTPMVFEHPMAEDMVDFINRVKPEGSSNDDPSQ